MKENKTLIKKIHWHDTTIILPRPIYIEKFTGNLETDLVVVLDTVIEAWKEDIDCILIKGK